MEKSIKKKRNSSIELLRIIAMIFIVLSHYSVHGGFKLELINNDLNRCFLQVITLGNLGVDIFVLISGYFIIKSKYSFKKIIQLIAQVLFYSILLYAIFIFSGNTTFSIKNFIKAIFPTIFQEYWFFTTYIILYIFTPYINKFLNHISRNIHFRLIIIMVVIWSIIPTFTPSDMYGNVVVQFFMLYLIGAYIRLYPDNLLIRNKTTSRMLIVVCTILLLLSTVILDSMHKYSSDLYSRSSILIVGLAIGILTMFLKINIPYNKIINIICGCTFGVYLIHENNYVRSWLWIDFLKNYSYADSEFLIIRIILSVIIVFVVCTIIEFLRKKLIEKPLMILVDKYYDGLKKYAIYKVKYLKSKVFNNRIYKI